jgi:branched-chain amino acid transport system ATP-binding protein
MTLLDIEDVTMEFGGLTALNDVDIEIESGEIVSLIGPNGAGKSTLINVITGMLTPTTGSIHYQGEDLVGKDPYEIVQSGVSRSFQTAEIFPELTVSENINVASLMTKHGSFSLNFFRRRDSYEAVKNRTQEILEMLALADDADLPAKSLPYGDTRRLEVAIGIATDPNLMFMDEPTAGMSPGQTEMTIDLIETMQDDWGITVLLVEHDMDVVFGISDRIVALHQGEIIARGTPDEIREDPAVRSAYLGGDAE